MSRLQELIDELCPDGVEYKRFDSVCTLKARIGWQRLTKAERLTAGDHLLVTGTDFRPNHTIDYSTCDFVTKERYDQDKNIQLRNGDVLLTKDGTLGKVVFVDGLPMPATLNSHLFVIRSNSNKLEQRFIMHYLLSHSFSSVMERNSAGSTIKGFTQKAFNSITIPVPPIEVQREIVRVLDSFQELDDALTAEIEAREQQLETYRDELLGKRLEKMYPDGLEYGYLGDLTTKIVDGSHKVPPKSSVEGALPMISAQNVIDGKLDVSFGRFVSPEAYAIEAQRTKVQRDDVLLTIVGAIGRTAVVETDELLAFQRSVCVITTDKELLEPRFLRYVLDSGAIQSYMTANARGAAQKGFYLAQVAGLRIPVPPIDAQREIVRMLDSFQQMGNEIRFERNTRRKQFEYYRDKLLSFPEMKA